MLFAPTCGATDLEGAIVLAKHSRQYKIKCEIHHEFGHVEGCLLAGVVVQDLRRQIAISSNKECDSEQ